MRPQISFAILLAASCTGAYAVDWSLDANPNLARYFEAEVATIETQRSLFNYKSLEEWEEARRTLHDQLLTDQLGVDPLRARTPLEARITGSVEEDDFVVENLHFQSLPGLYVTANFYRPKQIDRPLPTILYVCGHAKRAAGDVSFGNKAAYHHHGAWFARNGYACLTIDTLQLGEIEGIHHGTYREGRWWWNARGYTPAGVEAWNCVRALDYLETREEVDPDRFGVTGRSGGGAYSWWVTALDPRIKCAVPVAGITTLRNHVVDGCVEGHCDCMFMVNTHRWSYATLAALVAPRPLLISNTDKDLIFPLEGVVEVHRQVRHVYELYGKPKHLGLQITEGPHKDTQELRVHAFRWFNRWLKNDDSLIDEPAVSVFEPSQLRVFTDLPSDERNTSIDEDFVPRATEPSFGDAEEILSNQQRWFDDTVSQLRRQSFAAWPDSDKDWQPSDSVRIETVEIPATAAPEKKSLTVQRVHFLSQENVPLFVDLIRRKKASKGGVLKADEPAGLTGISSVRLFVAGDLQWQHYETLILGDDDVDPLAPVPLVSLLLQMTEQPGSAVAVFSPRGIGSQRWEGDQNKQIQIRRRFQLIGTTADAMRVWDIRRAMQVVRKHCTSLRALHVGDPGGTAELVLTASLFEPPADSIVVASLPESRDEQAVFLNAARFTSLPEILALATDRSPVRVKQAGDSDVAFARQLAGDSRWSGHALTVDE